MTQTYYKGKVGGRGKINAHPQPTKCFTDSYTEYKWISMVHT